MAKKHRQETSSEPMLGNLLARLDDTERPETHSMTLELTTTLDPLGFLGKVLSVYGRFRTEQNRLAMKREQLCVLERCAAERIAFEREESDLWRLHEKRVAEAQQAHEHELAHVKAKHERQLLQERIDGDLRVVQAETEARLRQLQLTFEHQLQAIERGLTHRSQMQIVQIEQQSHVTLAALDKQLEQRREELDMELRRLQSIERGICRVFKQIEKDDRSWKMEQRIRLRVFSDLSSKYNAMLTSNPPPTSETMFLATELMKTLSGDLINMHELRVRMRDQLSDNS